MLPFPKNANLSNPMSKQKFWNNVHSHKGEPKKINN